VKSRRTLAEELAFKADRKILHLEEEDHLRVDIPAGERLNLGVLALKIPSRWANMRNFWLTAAGLFLALFLITNAGAYSKWIQAELTDVGSQVQEQTQALLSNEEEPVIIAQDGIYPLQISPTPHEDRLRIPSIDVNSRVVVPESGLESLIGQDWNELEDQIRESLLNGVVHYPGTADPGERGNVFLTAHSSNVFWEPSPYNSTFALLPKMEVGDDIFVTHDQEEFHYRVISKEEVTPKEVGVLAQGEDFELTLMTCTPVGTTLRRLVVRAELIQD
jgi:LPXTG-site transpeptidase (sortase) family protein